MAHGVTPWGRGVAEAGFTLIEVIVVVLILGLLASIVVPRIVGRTDVAKRTAATVTIRELENALKLYRADNGFYPTTDQGLEALVTAPTTSPLPLRYNPDGYLDKVPKDPWGNGYIYLSPGIHSRDYDIESYGADGEDGGEDAFADIESWNLE
ncbi:MAG: type II secretion system protein GspG [Nitrospirae bacterium CG18_big_fil_WC_8_21_14_2_50_70_55]|nr:type II secretion system major pseudopilin GspG [Deltaproteobacteria bacterium]OIP63599.1 MAG: type II secretion system protein GspG [Nitrospirae bacterium CG2_30_70_394]PIQ05171.1 MAG: type II secretion system protein GspG [Nitrospirae bacterium CG18_big_fil_WC_8_21_14_2_50_70_55]PIU79602.1 MAG: type II secretion system protein GspG [Nitrospirae bacterium CG06_land_8_20_14_3_00_70_43]PIW83134.1 MAG: type II secretion system protein GspG [Nitrospirae bacterium CG_4_8_14_3_um_filter_70_85]PI